MPTQRRCVLRWLSSFRTTMSSSLASRETQRPTAPSVRDASAPPTAMSPRLSTPRRPAPASSSSGDWSASASAANASAESMRNMARSCGSV